MTRPSRALREDVHIHAPAVEVYGHLNAVRQQFWPGAIADVDTSEGLTFTLLMPARSERVSLVRTGEETARYLEFSAQDDTSSWHSLSWAVSAEGPREVHLVVEIAYKPAGGPLGWMLEEMLHRPYRRQVLRDSLWRLKLVAEDES